MVHLHVVLPDGPQIINLNTSYVMVHQEKKFAVWKRKQYLNTSYVMVHPTGKTTCVTENSFKYILCYGSSFNKHTCCRVVDHLNTSYVMVHHFSVQSRHPGSQHLNTSYVMVHRFIHH